MTIIYDTAQALADACGVSRRRIYKWRAEPIAPAPDSLDGAAWLDWLQRRGRRKAHDKLAAALAPTAENAPESPPAAKPTATHATNPGDLDADAPPIDSTLPVQEAWWKAKGMREKALAAARIRAREDQDLVPIVVVRAALTNLATSLVEILGQTIWQRMRPSLDGMAAERPDLVKRLRAEHDAGVAAVRTALAAAVPTALTKAFQQQESP